MESSEPAPDSPPRATPGDAAAPRTVTLASAVDIAGFRVACRRLWAEQTEPARVVWRTAGDAEDDLFESPAAPPSRAGTVPPLHVPAGFLALCEDVVQHSDPGRFELLYRLLWRLQHEPSLRDDVLDADRVAAREMAQAVRRDRDADASKPPPDGEAPRSLPALREALQRCRECPLGEQATRAVPGEGPEAREADVRRRTARRPGRPSGPALSSARPASFSTARSPSSASTAATPTSPTRSSTSSSSCAASAGSTRRRRKRRPLPACTGSKARSRWSTPPPWWPWVRPRPGS